MKLSELQTSEKGFIVKVLGHGGFRKRIIEMGFVKGKMVESVQNAPLNDPVKYRIMGYEVSLRRSEAELVEVISEEEAVQTLKQENPIAATFPEEEMRKVALYRRKEIKVVLVGNPNCGKTTLFNIASGSHEHVGNYSGVTIDSKEGIFEQDGFKFHIVDLPGTYSLSAYSPEEKYVREYLLNEKPDIVINVVDASNLERNLYLTTQLIDMHLQNIVALNMYDELQQSGDKLDYKNLGKLLGIPFVPIIAKTGFGIIQLFRSVIKLYESTYFIDEEGVLINSVKDDMILDEYHHNIKIEHKHEIKNSQFDLVENGKTEGYVSSRHIHINYGNELERSIRRLRDVLVSKNHYLQNMYSFRYLAIKLLENDAAIYEQIGKEPNAPKIFEIRDEEIKRIHNVLSVDAETAISDAKYGFIEGALKETYFPGSNRNKHTLTSKLDALLIHKYWSYPIFFLLIFTMFEATFKLGQYPMDWIENGVSWMSNVLQNSMSDGPLKELLINGILGGVGGVIVFLPNILILYFFISLMEDSGYMARAAFIMDKIMHKMGLHGKSFIPLIMGFGCNVPAIMSTRTIENRNSRLITILINPLMSCSARLPLYLLLAGTFFPNHAGLVLFGIYFTGISLAVIIARLLKRFIFKKNETPFVMELPPYRVPTGKSILNHTWEKGKQYLKKIGTIILVCSIIIWFLGYYPRPKTEIGTVKNTTETTQLENSYIGKIGHTIQPVLSPLGFDWKISVSLLTGIAAKEIVVSTLGVIYSDNSNNTRPLSEKLKNEVKVDGNPVYTSGTALAFMLFVLIYFPCLATIVAIKNETGGWKWALFSAGYSLVLAWLVAYLAQLIF